jgi:hypothetical protein
VLYIASKNGHWRLVTKHVVAPASELQHSTICVVFAFNMHASYNSLFYFNVTAIAKPDHVILFQSVIAKTLH